VRILPFGRHAELVEYDTIEEVIAVAGQLRERRPEGVEDVVAGMRTVLIRYVDQPVDLAGLLDPSTPGLAAGGGPVVEIDVHYDGPDLEQVAATVGVSVEALIEVHASVTYTAAFCGFTPGFAYLTGVPPELCLPRRSTPRPSVPAGSVAIAGGFTAVYPTASPGGWHLLGHTDAVMFDPLLAEPALLTAGASVRFRRA
jgi:KipI family sensor histidine kinase inhibitor